MSKAPVSEGAMFLHQCIVHSDCKFNWQAVGQALDINASAASMRMTRLKDRIKKQGATAAKGWSGELDQDATFLFQCIMTCNCKIDYKKVGAALQIKSSAASMRFTRLKAKYAIPEATQALPAAAPQIRVAAQADVTDTKKRKIDECDSASESEEIHEPQKKKKTAIVKEEDGSATDEDNGNEMVNNPSRQTRGKKLDLQKMLNDAESDKETARIPNVDGSGDYEDEYSDASADDDSDDDWSAEESDSSSNTRKKQKKRSGLPTPTRTPKKVPVRARSARNATPTPTKVKDRVKDNVKKISPNTPVALSGMSLLQSHITAAQTARKVLPSPVRAISISSGTSTREGNRSVNSSTRSSRTITALPISEVDRSNSYDIRQGSVASSVAASAGSLYVSASASLAPSFVVANDDDDNDDSHDSSGLQLQTDLDKHVKQWQSEVEQSEEVMHSVEEVSGPASGFFSRLFFWNN